MLITFDSIDLLIGLAVGGIILSVLWWRGRGFVYLVIFALFWAYLLAVVAVVAFPIAVEQDLVGEPFSPNVNLQPFYVGACQPFAQCVRRLVENVLLTIPFGFGLPLLLTIKPKRIAFIALGIGLSLEAIQLVLALLFHSRFRVIDINDVMLNALGVAIGYTAERYLLAISFFSFLQPTPLPTQGNILPTATSSEK